MDKKLLYKLLAISLMSLLLLIPLAMIEGQISQRSGLQTEVQQSIAASSAGEQTLVGPVLAIQYRERLEPEVIKDVTTGQQTVTPRFADHTLYLPPEVLQLEGSARAEKRYRGIYQARLFHLDAAIKGRFGVPARLGLSAQADIISAEAALILSVSDARGVDNDPEVTINGKKHRFSVPKSHQDEHERLLGTHLKIDLGKLALDQSHAFDFTLPLQMTGTERLTIAPTGEANQISLTSNWQHPSFGGRFLPRERAIGAEGFTARWEISHLARNFANTLVADRAGMPEALSITFLDPVNVYLQAERAVKYGVLFIVLTFGGFFLTEVLRRSPIHAMQYLLVGLALAIFFLLLIALSEHMPFAAAYAIAATACILLIAFYLAGALGGWRAGLGFGAGLTGLYGVLFGVLLSEDNSLLMGSALLFLALAATMLATRRVDWYRVSANIVPRTDE